MVRILGIDPGSRLTGYGCIDLLENHIHLITHGTLKLAHTKNNFSASHENRLLLLYQGLSKIIRTYKPKIMVVEKVFFAKNAVSALKLGQVRGATLVCGALHGLPVVEYNPTEIKASLVGYGRADKTQVARLVELIIGRQKFASPDASDALALAIHHAYCLRHQNKKRTNLALFEKKKGNKKFSLAESVAHVTKMSFKRIS